MTKGKSDLVDLIGYIAGYNAVARTYLQKIRELVDQDESADSDFDPTVN